jgi:hypothetical protein
MIALGPLHVDLAAPALVEPGKVRVFPNKPVTSASRPAWPDPREGNKSAMVDFSPGSVLTWDGKAWKIANVGHNLITLVGDQQSFVELPLDAFEALVVERSAQTRLPARRASPQGWNRGPGYGGE